MRNIATKPSAKSMGVSKLMEPRQSVPSQLKIFTPVGTPIMKVMKPKKGCSTAPVVNIWCAQTLKPRPPIPMVAKTKALYPKSC